MKRDNIDLAHVKNVCGLGLGTPCCSVLTNEAGTWTCQKGGDFETLLRARRERGQMTAKGDNCSGQPDFTPTPMRNPAWPGGPYAD